MLAQIPVALGVLYCDPKPSYGDGMAHMKDEARKRASGQDLNALMTQGHTWTVSGEAAE